MNHAAESSPVSQNVADSAAWVCPLCAEIVGAQGTPGFQGNPGPSDSKDLYGSRVCAACAGRFTDRRWMAFMLDMVVLGYAWLLVDVVIQVAKGDLHAISHILPLNLLLAPLGMIGLPCWPITLAGSFNLRGRVDFAQTLLVLATFACVLLKDGFRGQSPGKHWLGLRVVDRETLRPTSLGGSMKRNLALLMPFFLGYIAVGLTLRRRGRFGEKWAGTVVIEDRFRDNPVFTGGRRRCRACSYDLTGNVSGRCPECGEDVYRMVRG
ncbi:MAG: RDD family protein [Phycisphaerales bacterium]|nr:RDD family protein [Phycisphaerales bacterium]